MRTNDPLRRAPLKRAGLALLAALACTAPAAAQNLNVADTLAYINQRCTATNDPHDMRNVSFITSYNRNIFALMKWRLPSRGSGAHTMYSMFLFDLRRVDISKPSTESTILFQCGDIGCIGLNSYYLETDTSVRVARDVLVSSDDINPTLGNELGLAKLDHCRQPDRVAKAFKHLQQLFGGRIADPVDPFAN